MENKVALNDKQLNGARAFLRGRVIGAQLDRFCSYGILIQLCFLERSSSEEFWISCMSTLSEGQYSTQVNTENEFRESRKQSVGLLQSLVGDSVTDLDIDPSGNLQIELGGQAVTISGRSNEFEEVWYVSGGHADLYRDPKWLVVLTNDGKLTTKS